jgi:GT2 family glycosyltransferase
MKTIGIVILNFNGIYDTVECLESLSQVTMPKDCVMKIVVIDNASKERVKHQISSISEKYKKMDVHVVENVENKGFTGGNNDGMKFLLDEGASYVVLLNNDTIVSPSFLSNLIQSSEKNPHAIVGPKIYFAPGFEYHDRYKKSEQGHVIWYAGGIIDWDNMYCSHRGVDEVDLGQYDKPGETPFVTGCCMLIPREVIEMVGYLNNNYFAYLEDVEYCLRALKHGFSLRYEPSSVIWHKNAQSSGKSGSNLHVYYQTRNRMMLGLHYAPVRTRLALLRESIRLLSTDTVQRQAMRDFYFHRYGKKQ